MRYFYIFILAMSISSMTYSASFYKCVNTDGSISFSDSKCKVDAKSESIEIKTKSKTSSTSESTQKYSFDPNVLLIKSSLTEGIKADALIPASDSDLNKWQQHNNNAEKVLERVNHMDAYVVKKPIRIGDDISLGGANAVVFLVYDNKLMPEGYLGHSIVLFPNTGACKGHICRR